MGGKWRSFLDRRFYPGFSENWDDSLLREEVVGSLRRGQVALDLGAGPGILPQMDFSSVGAAVVGVDVDPRIRENTAVSYRVLASAEALPFRPEVFEVVIANNVLEHLKNPEESFNEVARVLTPGGRFLAKTPNKNHYVTLISRLTPHRFHRWIVGLRGRASADTYETHYRANTRKDISRWADLSGLEVDFIKEIEGRPEYCRINSFLYVLGLCYERLVNRFAGLRRFRVLILCQLRRAEDPTLTRWRPVRSR